ncbi:DUF1272 domain-containing protein [Klebsiella pneumoniae subsp. pneumoniae]|nr:DUF1272 domain-containing protein [Klebsiella pneumoniae subsp. pneumoniae]
MIKICRQTHPRRLSVHSECTFCRDCMTTRLNGHCPNCGGELVRRPVRPERRCGATPASTLRRHAQ